jgi:lysozyme
MKKFAQLLIIILAVALGVMPLTSCRHHSVDTVTRRLADGSVYRGQMAGGRFDGLGVLTQGDSVVYSGHWQRGMRQGQGTCTDTLGRRINGVWSHDTLVWGTRRDSTGVYRGEFNRQLLADGHGSFASSNGHYYEGLWHNDKRQGFGFSSEQRYFRVGEWKRNVYKGERLNYTSERIYGIDLSKYQHILGKRRYGIDWSKLRISHLGSLSKKNVSGKVDYKISFIFIKSTEGTTVLNPYFRGDYLAAKRHGYPVGAYHFFSTRTTGTQQAYAFLKHTPIASDDLPPVLDLEPLPSKIKEMGGVGQLWRSVRAWLSIVEERTGMRPILYISQTFVNRYLPAAPDIKQKYPVWIARYGEYKPDIKLCVWQLAPDGRVSGIHTTVDINVFNGYGTEFNKWVKTKKYE